MPSRIKNYLEWISADDNPLVAFEALVATKPSETRVPRHDPPLTDREEAIYLLHIASEVEHALMLQYLYAAFSLGGPQVPEEHKEKVCGWRETIIGVAREEMGHLATVQNILQLIGGPITFDREDFPIPPGLYPFSFTLEPLTLTSLRNYVLAEMPDLNSLSSEEKIDVEAIIAAGTQHVDRVGLIYAQILNLLETIPDADFAASSVIYQARGDEWGLGHGNLLILSATNRDEAKKALQAVAEQGEAADMPHARLATNSHFERFLKLFHEYPKSGDWQPNKALPINPVVPRDSNAVDDNQTPITNPNAQKWAKLSNLRYRLLLSTLSHAFLTSSAPSDAQKPTSRGLLVSWAFGEMYHLRSLGDILASQPLTGSDDGYVAGIPFEMPYTLALPERDQDRWRLHRDILIAADRLAGDLLEDPGDYGSYLKGMQSADRGAMKAIAAIVDA